MKSLIYTIAFLLLGGWMLLAFNHFELPVIFLFQETKKIPATVMHTEITEGIRGRGHYQLLTYNYEVDDSVYVDKIEIGKRLGGLKSIGDRLQIEYAINQPEKHKVTGYYPASKENPQSLELNSKTKQ